jgi:hypothetical protein
MNTNTATEYGDGERRLQERLLLDRRVEGDRLMLDDATLTAALDGSRPLTAGERTALQASPLTLRRLRRLAIERRAAQAGAADRPGGQSVVSPWRASHGRLRAASGGEIDALRTDDGWFILHLVADGPGWKAILQLAAEAPFAPALLAARAPLRVRDGAGRTILEGRLDADGECEAAWPFRESPADHLQAAGAAFAVEALPG